MNEIFKVYAASTIDLMCSVHSSGVVSVLSCMRTFALLFMNFELSLVSVYMKLVECVCCFMWYVYTVVQYCFIVCSDHSELPHLDVLGCMSPLQLPTDTGGHSDGVEASERP